ncbi:MAG: glycerol kinase GlpK [Myxococcota bacterium]|jgi:glycerol kinase|nr:glycerol kinase GlpK [Myxococcota bacterium]
MQHLVAIDQGTTQTTVLIIDEALCIVGSASREFPQIYPKPGWVEHDAEVIWKTVLEALEEAISQSGAPVASVAGIGITNQRETTVLWDRRTLVPLHNAIVWQCRRTTEACQALRDKGFEPLFRERTGLVLDPYFSGTKLAYLLDHVNGARQRARDGELCFGTIDSYLLCRLTGGKSHVTDLSNASRTLLCDIRKGLWDEELLTALRIPAAVLPRISSCSEILGKTQGLGILPDGIPIAGMAGDQQAALFGQACFAAGQAKCTYGTGAFLMMNTGDTLVRSKHGLLTTVAWKLGEQITYALEGSLFVAGAAVQWLRDGLGLIVKASEIEPLARSVPDSAGVVFVPALAGLGAPYWRAEARGLISGITRSTTAAHLARACLEGMALQVTDVVTAMEQDAQAKTGLLRVDGGASANDLLMQIQADLIGAPISRPKTLETTALGAACLAGLGVGLFRDQAEIAARWAEERRFDPRFDPQSIGALKDAWVKAVGKA